MKEAIVASLDDFILDELQSGFKKSIVRNVSESEKIPLWAAEIIVDHHMHDFIQDQ